MQTTFVLHSCLHLRVQQSLSAMCASVADMSLLLLDMYIHEKQILFCIHVCSFVDDRRCLTCQLL